MKKNRIVFILFAAILSSCGNGPGNPNLPSAAGGTLDLSAWKFDGRHNVPVQGEWEIYWGELLTPAQVRTEGDATNLGYADATLKWRNLYVNGRRLPGDGCATFRLTVLLPETNRVYGIIVPDINSAYRIFINGAEAGSSGTVAASKEGFFPHVVYKTYFFDAPQGKAEIVLQVAHFGSKDGGGSGIIRLGPADSVQLAQRVDEWLTYFLLGALIIISIYNIALFIPMNKYPAPFFFGLFSVVMILLFLFKTSGLVPTLFPTVNSFLLLRFDFILLFMVMPLYNSMIYMLYKQYVSLIVVIIANVLSLLLLIPGIFIPLDWMAIIGSIYGMIIFANAVYLIAAMIRSYRAGVKKALYLIVGTTVFFAAAFNDFLYTSRIAHTFSLVSIGIFVLILCQALMLTQIFAETYLLSENLTREMKKKNEQLNEFAEQLEQKVEERTNELRKAQNQIIVQEKLASLGKLTAGIAHEIKNPLNFVNNFAQLSGELVEELKTDIAKSKSKIDGEDFENIEANLDSLKFNVAKINEHGERADNIVKSMLQHAREKSDKKSPVSLNSLVDEFVDLAYHGQRAKDSSFAVKIEKDFDPEVGTVEVFAQDLSRVVLNIAGNAFYALQERARTARKDYAPVFRAVTKRLANAVEIRLRDNGTGIPPEVLEKLFTPFFTTKPAGKGTGLGLSLSYDIVVQEHKGELKVETEKGKYTEFVIRIPV